MAAGGLHVVGTERHESRRIDNQVYNSVLTCCGKDWGKATGTACLSSIFEKKKKFLSHPKFLTSRLTPFTKYNVVKEMS